MKDIRIAAVISNCPIGNTKDNLNRMVDRIDAAKKHGVSIICFPEMNITGYTIDPSIAYFAEPVPGPITRNLSHLSRQNDIVIFAGMAEKNESGRIFASHLVAKPNGSIGVYRKLHIAPPERDVYTAGSKVPLFEACGVRFGIQLCYDAHFPELTTRMALNGTDMVFMPHASPRGTPEDKVKSWMRHLPARAYDNGIFIVACNQTGENEGGLKFPGIALIIGPSGNILAKDTSGKESMLIADLKEDELNRIKSHPMRYFLPNRRPDISDLKVEEG